MTDGANVLAFQIFEGVQMMEESDTYLAILDQGEERGIRNMILMLGQDRFGAADESVKSELQGITDLDVSEGLAAQLPKRQLGRNFSLRRSCLARHFHALCSVRCSGASTPVAGPHTRL